MIFPKTVRLLTCLLLQCNILIANNIQGSLFTSVLQKLDNDGLGAQAMQNYVNSKSAYTSFTVDGATSLDQLEVSLSKKFSDTTKAVRRLNAVVQSSYSQFMNNRQFDHCCNPQNLEENAAFKSKVNMDALCVHERSNSVNNLYPTSALLDAMKTNQAELPGLKWQYFASEQGMMTSFPSHHFCEKTYDPRFKSWYAEAATPVSKDVVLIIDKSGSMGTLHNNEKSLMTIAKEAAQTVVATLNPNDRVNVVTFSTNAEAPTGNAENKFCFSSKLAMATPQNKKYLNSYITGIYESGSTYYGKALRKAFYLLENTPVADNEDERKKAILFLTDGNPSDTDSSILDVLRQENARFNNQIIVLTFALGNGITTSGQTILTNMAQQSTADLTAGPITAGTMTKVENPSNLRSSLAEYYYFFSDGIELEEVIFSVPYVDGFGIGLVTSACLPAYYNTKLIGVSCVDITMSELLSEVTYYNQGALSYAFIIDGKGRTLMHPLLPIPFYIHQDPIFVHLNSLERNSGIANILNSMTSEGSGSDVLLASHVRPRGDLVREGVYTVQVLSTYRWKPVRGSNFSLCLVTAENDIAVKTQQQTNYLAKINYFRLDLKQEYPTCNYLNRVVTDGISMIQFTPRSFVNPYIYLSSVEKASDIDRYAAFLAGGPSHDNIKPGVRDTVLLTSYLDTIWSDRLDINKYAIWRYMGTEDGVFRLFPGSNTDKNYDHTRRAWYKRSIGNKDVMCVSAPYVDSFGAGYVVTLSKVIFATGLKKAIIGAMGMDFTLPYFYYIFVDQFENCKDLDKTCFIMDDSGQVVVHKSWFEGNDLNIPDFEFPHIIKEEPAIAKTLITDGIMTRQSCIDFESLHKQNFWKVELVSSNVYTKSNFEIHDVPETNLYIGIYSGQKKNDPSCRCDSNTEKCQSTDSKMCECPCYLIADFAYCEDKFKLGNDGSPPCLPEDAPLNLSGIAQSERGKALTLESCLSVQCDIYSDQGSCLARGSCSWCRMTSDGNNLSKPYCTTSLTCYWGIEGRSPGDDGGKSSKSLSIGAIVGIVIGCLFLLVLGGVAYVYWRHSSEPSRGATPSVPVNPHTGQHYHNHALEMEGPDPSAPEPPPPYGVAVNYLRTK